MDNPSPQEKIQDVQDSLRKEQGGTVKEGGSGDPHSKHEKPCPESGHGSGGKKSY